MADGSRIPSPARRWGSAPKSSARRSHRIVAVARGQPPLSRSGEVPSRSPFRREANPGRPTPTSVGTAAMRSGPALSGGYGVGFWRRVTLWASMLSDRFRTAVEHGNLDEATELFSEDAVFRSPVGFKPYEGRDQVAKVLRAAERVLGVGGEFRYLHQLEDPDDRVAMLEFATVVEGKQVEGIDILTFDDSGMITELKVMIRPASALQLVGAKMAEEFPKVGLRLPS